MKELHDLELVLTSHTPVLVIESLEEVKNHTIICLTRLSTRPANVSVDSD